MAMPKVQPKVPAQPPASGVGAASPVATGSQAAAQEVLPQRISGQPSAESALAGGQSSVQPCWPCRKCSQKFRPNHQHLVLAERRQEQQVAKLLRKRPDLLCYQDLKPCWPCRKCSQKFRPNHQHLVLAERRQEQQVAKLLRKRFCLSASPDSLLQSQHWPCWPCRKCSQKFRPNHQHLVLAERRQEKQVV
eukprot:symbB.v1.2.015527.t1/scaffold1161.1/size184519/2